MTLSSLRKAVLLAAVAILSSCASVSFKRGASGESMAQEERACRQESGSASYEECMRARGQLVRPASPTAVPPSRPVATPRAASTAPPPTAPARSPTAGPSPTPESVTPAAEGDEADPSARVPVSSWWKLGGKPDELDAAITACVTELGLTHRLEPGSKLASNAMIACLRRAGWYPLGQGSTR